MQLEPTERILVHIIFIFPGPGKTECISTLFNDTVSSYDYAVLNVGMTGNNELEMMWKELVMA
jgi:hypothetical protein